MLKNGVFGLGVNARLIDAFLRSLPDPRPKKRPPLFRQTVNGLPQPRRSMKCLDSILLWLPSLALA
ncbi:hypothetical protein CDBH8_0777 [Corynebacterium diphtheriae BH8]|nr:hypothetical protein CDBH8_0777 [Corynebacterium diphtheriae BH8]